MYQTIIVTDEGAEDAKAVTITLNRASVRNALSRQMRIELIDAFEHAKKMKARVIVLTGSGGSFSSGQDLADVSAHEKLDIEATLRDEYEPLINAIISSPAPVIAAVNGVAAGAGANLALACDVVIATESATFIQAFTRIGLMPDAGGTYWLPRQIGFSRAMGAMLFADPIPARQAAEWGMIWEVIADKDFETHIKTRAKTLAHGATVAYGALKTALRQSYSNTLHEQLALEALLQGVCGKSADFKEGVQAFLEKRHPKLSGK